VFTARYALSPHIKQIRFVFKGLNVPTVIRLVFRVVRYLNNNKKVKWNEAAEMRYHTSFCVIFQDIKRVNTCFVLDKSGKLIY
jgi:hypothetical protein